MFLPYKYCLYNCVSIELVSIPDLLYFSLCFLILEMMVIICFWSSLQWLTMEKWEWSVFTKIWISGEWERFRPNKSMIFKGLPFRRKITIKKDIADRRFKAHCLISHTFDTFFFLWKTKILVLATVQSNVLVVQMFNHKIALGNCKH